MEDFKINQLTKELVVIRLKNMGDPCIAAAELVRKTLAVALKGTPPNDANFIRVVREACQGGMTGLLVTAQNMPVGAVRMLEAVGEMAMELGFDPTRAMRGAIEGIADMHRFLTVEQMDAIRKEIDANLLGAGDVFYETWQAVAHLQPHEGTVERPEI
jgi:hypothetical protein